MSRQTEQQQMTRSTPWLVTILLVVSVIFIGGQLLHIEPLMKLFRWLALVF